MASGALKEAMKDPKLAETLERQIREGILDGFGAKFGASDWTKAFNQVTSTTTVAEPPVAFEMARQIERDISAAMVCDISHSLPSQTDTLRQQVADLTAERNKLQARVEELELQLAMPTYGQF